jgi:hypothetical protein
MIKVCKSCGKEEFQNLTESVYYIQALPEAFWSFAQMIAPRTTTLLHSYKMKEMHAEEN